MISWLKEELGPVGAMCGVWFGEVCGLARVVAWLQVGLDELQHVRYPRWCVYCVCEGRVLICVLCCFRKMVFDENVKC